MTTLLTRLIDEVRSNLPPQRLVIESSLTPAEVIERLQGVTAAHGSRSGRDQTDTVFRGVVGGHDFRLVRIIAYRNSFVPIVEGRVEPVAHGSRMTATIRLPRLVAAFEFLWFGIITLVMLGLLHGVLSGHDSGWILLAPLGFYGAGVGLLMSGFGPEARRSRASLEAIVAGHPPPALTGDWLESADDIAWRDVRRAGWLGYIAVLSYPVSMGLALYTWIHLPGCTRQETLDPTIRCPAAWRTFSVWGVFAGVGGAAFLGGMALRRRRRLLLVLALAYNVAAVAVLLWILGNAAFFPRPR